MEGRPQSAGALRTAREALPNGAGVMVPRGGCDPLLQLSLSARFCAVRAALLTVCAELRDLGQPSDTIARLEIVLAEALNNIIDHARLDPARDRISLRIGADPAGLHCHLSDAGREPVPSKTARSSPTAPRLTGAPTTAGHPPANGPRRPPLCRSSRPGRTGFWLAAHPRHCPRHHLRARRGPEPPDPPHSAGRAAAVRQHLKPGETQRHRPLGICRPGA